MASDITSSHPTELQSVQALWGKVTILESKFDSFAAEIRQALTQLIAHKQRTKYTSRPLDPPVRPLHHPVSSDDNTICRDCRRPIRPDSKSNDDFDLLDRHNARFGAPRHNPPPREQFRHDF